MKITNVVGRIDDYPDYRVDQLVLHSDDLARRVLRAHSKSGAELKIVLSRGTVLHRGDVLFVDVTERSVIAIEVEPEAVLVVYPTNFAETAEASHQLGNRHIPIQLLENQILVPYHPTLDRLFQSLNIRSERELRTLEKPFLHVFAPHMHGV